jgi:hypothetical protein
MKKYVSLGITCITLVLLAVLVVLPVTGMVAPTNAGTTSVVSPTAITTTSVTTTTVSTVSPSATGATGAKPFISATVSSQTPAIGDPVTISGVATGGNLNSGVQIWLFAGNYVNVTTVPVNQAGSFSKTFSTTGLPPATIYVFVQSPGTDGNVDIDLYDAGVYTGQVVNTRTKATVFNFTGTGSVQDAAASKALSDALNQPGQDDIYTKLTFQLTVTTPQVVTTTVAVPATTAAPAASTTAKSPLPPEVTAGALVIGGCCAAFIMRKMP